MDLFGSGVLIDLARLGKQRKPTALKTIQSTSKPWGTPSVIPQQDDVDPNRLAGIAQEHSVWSRKLAVAQAHKDYYAAYHPTLTSVLPEMPALLDCRRDVVTKKRSLLGSSLGQSGRRVRCRMF